MKALIFTALVLAIIYLGAVMVTLSWNACDWPLWVQIVAGIMAVCNVGYIAFLVLVVCKWVKEEENG